MRRATICGYAAMALIAATLLGCGKMPVYRWHSGKPASFALADGELVPVDARMAGRSALGARAETGVVEVKDYGDLNLTFRNDSTAHRAHYETLGTYIGSYTPETFPVAMVKVAFLRSDSDEGFWVVQTNEGVFGDVEFLDLTAPVYVRDNVLWQPGEYDMLLVKFDIASGGAGGESVTQPVRVTVPGYTDAELPDIPSTTTLADGSEEITGWNRQYAGDNVFLLSGLERPWSLRSTTYLMFRQEIRTGQVIEANWWQYADGTPVPGAYVSEGEIEGIPVGEIYGGQWNDNPHIIPWYSGNTWFWSQPWGYGHAPLLWADIPFQGLSIQEDTKALEMIIRWDLENLVELWDFTDDGLQLVLAPDFMDRFSMEVTQIE